MDLAIEVKVMGLVQLQFSVSYYCSFLKDYQMKHRALWTSKEKFIRLTIDSNTNGKQKEICNTIANSKIIKKVKNHEVS